MVELVVLVALLSGVVGVLAGYRDGVRLAESAVPTPGVDPVYEQYKLGLQDYQNGRYELARQRLEYVVALRPDAYPQAWDYLTRSLMALNATATFTPAPPTLTPTAIPTLTPTRDLSGAQSIFQRAQMLMSQGDWDGAIVALLALRDEDLYYRVVEVDDMLYTALRQRGEQRILSQGDLEGGIYDLSLAEKFGPLDYNATVYRDWARLYLTALGFWEAYPEQAVYYFGQVAAAVPGLRDGSGLTAAWRYHWSLIHYGNQLAAEGEWCAARTQYEQALAYNNNPDVEPTATYVAYQCAPPTAVPSATPTITPTPTATPTITLTATAGPSPTPTLSPTGGAATLTPTATFTPTPSPAATATVTPTATTAPTATDTPFPSATPLPSDTPLPSNTPAPTSTPLPTDTPAPTNTPLPTDTPAPSPTPG